MAKLPLIRIGDQVFAEEGGTEFGAVRQVAVGGKPVIMVYVENGGDFLIPLTAVSAVHDSKVILAMSRLDPIVQRAIGQAHAREDSASAAGLRQGE